MSPYEISLSSHEKKILQQMANKYTSPYFEVIRAKAILLAADGLENKQIGERARFATANRQQVAKTLL